MKFLRYGENRNQSESLNSVAECRAIVNVNCPKAFEMLDSDDVIK